MSNLTEALGALRHYVEHPNQRSEIVTKGATYQQKSPSDIQAIAIDGMVIGYQVKESSPLEISPYFDRYAYLRVPGYKLSDLRKSGELKPILTAMLDAFIEPQAGEVKVKQLSEDTIRFGQRFMIAMQVNTNPNLTTLAGGL